MSHLGKKPFNISEGVEVKLEERILSFSGKKGKLSQAVLPFLKVVIDGRDIVIQPTADHKQARANWGTMAALVKSAIKGVSDGFSKSLIIEGVGYRANWDGKNLTLSIGFSHPIKYAPAEGITVNVDKNTIKIEGVSKQLVGETAAKIRQIKKPEPYKGRGIRYADEIIKRKAGKKAVAAAA